MNAEIAKHAEKYDLGGLGELCVQRFLVCSTNCSPKKPATRT